MELAAELAVGQTVEALPESNTWMYDNGVMGIITEIFPKDEVLCAVVKVQKKDLRRKSLNYILREWAGKGWTKPEEDFLLLDDGIPLIHLKAAEMLELTIEEKVNELLDQAFGARGSCLGIAVVSYPVGLIITPGVCLCEGCDQLRTHFAWHNCWGTVEAFEVCESHYTELNGRCSDGFPLKKELLVKTG